MILHPSIRKNFLAYYGRVRSVKVTRQRDLEIVGSIPTLFFFFLHAAKEE